MPSTNPQTTPTEPQLTPEPTEPAPIISPQKAHMSVVAIVAVAVVVALGLVTVGFLAYNTKDEPAVSETSDATSDDTIDSTSLVDTDAVDEAADQVDQSVDGLDNSSDFNDSDLSEANLGF